MKNCLGWITNYICKRGRRYSRKKLRHNRVKTRSLDGRFSTLKAAKIEEYGRRVSATFTHNVATRRAINHIVKPSADEKMACAVENSRRGKVENGEASPAIARRKQVEAKPIEAADKNVEDFCIIKTETRSAANCLNKRNDSKRSCG